MPHFLFSLRPLSAVCLLVFAVACEAPKKDKAATAAPDNSAYPAAEGFNKAGSDAKAIAIADRVMEKMGGYPNWQKAHFLGWSFFGGQYQIWDKYTGDFHWQKDDLVANYNLNKKTGHAYKAGQDISNTEEGKQLLDKMYPTWVNNSWWLVMPFKLKDSGVTLKYKGPAKTRQGADADMLEMTFQNVGVTPDNRYEVLVNKATGLVDEWAYFPKATDAKPAFRRRWSDYSRHDGIMLAADRSDSTKTTRLDDIAAVQTLPAGIMTSPTPVTKIK
ncbi:hypothetical protein [Hymenobacter sp. BT491]|uniref:hypothetical protein n=1 Tax=Hymenobacter sp. BT491 TaxID=2766779 RepID=UPI00165386FF|nr:hypothetical protein [Hymenobacter sp. BT491]MBC6991227.1 hypothetical protein [Hymenobacter sp. BT491]